MTRIPRLTAALCLVLAASTLSAQDRRLPDPVLDPKVTGEKTAVLAGGCFWGVEAVFEALNGVKNVVSGFSGGSKSGANYNVVSTGTTGHAESVKFTYDPAKISYGQLLKVFFQVAHDPTQLNRQGPDEGPQYRSAIFFSTPEQKAVAEAYISQLNNAHVFPAPHRDDGLDSGRVLSCGGRAPGLHRAQSDQPVRARERPSEDQAAPEGFSAAAEDSLTALLK